MEAAAAAMLCAELSEGGKEEKKDLITAGNSKASREFLLHIIQHCVARLLNILLQ